MLGLGGVIRRTVRKSLKVILTAGEHKEIRRDDLEGAKVFVCDPEYFVCLVRLDQCLSELLHLLRGHWLGERNDKVVIQVALTILGYLLKVGLRGLHQVHCW